MLRILSLSLGTLALLQLAIVPASSVVQWLKLVTGRIDHDQYYASHVAWKYVAGDDMKAARYIAENSRSADGVVVFGSDAVINFLSGRANPTRFLYAFPLTEGGPASPRDAYRREYVSRIRQAPPVYVVIGLPFATSDKERVLHDFPELESFLHQHYALAKSIGFLDLYRSKQ